MLVLILTLFLNHFWLNYVPTLLVLVKQPSRWNFLFHSSPGPRWSLPGWALVPRRHWRVLRVVHSHAALNRLSERVTNLFEGSTYQSPLGGVAAGSPPNQGESGWWGGRCLWVTWSDDYLSTPISNERVKTQFIITIRHLSPRFIKHQCPLRKQRWVGNGSGCLSSL